MFPQFIYVKTKSFNEIIGINLNEILIFEETSEGVSITLKNGKVISAIDKVEDVIRQIEDNDDDDDWDEDEDEDDEE